MTPQAQPQVVNFEGTRHEFPADFSQAEISQALASLHPQAQQPNPETFGQGLKSTLPIGGAGFGPKARLTDFIGTTLNQLASMKDAYDKAADAHSKGRDFEALTHLVGVIPFVGTAIHHAGETLGGTEAQYDKFGNIVKPGLQPNPAGAAGETLGLAAPALVDTGAGAPRAVGTAAIAAREALAKPGTGKIVLGAGEMTAGGAALLHGNLWGLYPLARGGKTLGKGLAERAAANAPAADAEMEAFAPGFSKMSAKDQATTRMVYDRLKNGPPPSSAPPPGRIGPLYNPPAAPQAQPASQAPPAPSPAPAAEAAPEAAVPPAQPPAPEPPPRAPQASPGPPAAARGGFPERARGVRSANADTLSQALQDAGQSSAALRNIRVWEWPALAKQVGIDFPVTHSARLKLIRDTIGRLEEREIDARAPR